MDQEKRPLAGVRLESDLRLIREARGLSRDDVYARAHIRPEVLKQVEENGFGGAPALSSDIHRRSFMKHVAEAIGVTFDDAVEALDEHSRGQYSGLLAERYLGPGGDLDTPRWAVQKKHKREPAEPDEPASDLEPDTSDSAAPPVDDVGLIETPDGLADPDDRYRPPSLRSDHKRPEPEPVVTAKRDEEPAKAPVLVPPAATPEPPEEEPLDVGTKESGHEGEWREVPPRRSRWLIPAGATAIVVAIVAIWIWTPRSDDTAPPVQAVRQSESPSRIGLEGLPEQLSGFIRFEDESEQFVTMRIDSVLSQGDRFAYTLNTRMGDAIYQTTGVGEWFAAESRVKFLDPYGWGAAFDRADGSVVLRSWPETRYPMWELSGD
jgi:hypothetical protein